MYYQNDYNNYFFALSKISNKHEIIANLDIKLPIKSNHLWKN